MLLPKIFFRLLWSFIKLGMRCFFKGFFFYSIHYSTQKGKRSISPLFVFFFQGSKAQYFQADPIICNIQRAKRKNKTFRRPLRRCVQFTMRRSVNSSSFSVVPFFVDDRSFVFHTRLQDSALLCEVECVSFSRVRAVNG